MKQKKLLLLFKFYHQHPPSPKNIPYEIKQKNLPHCTSAHLNSLIFSPHDHPFIIITFEQTKEKHLAYLLAPFRDPSRSVTLVVNN